jgi:hypothetical protein
MSTNDNIDIDYDNEEIMHNESDINTYDNDKLEYVIIEMRDYCNKNYLPLLNNKNTVDIINKMLNINI